jgi:hypothetical protein
MTALHFCRSARDPAPHSTFARTLVVRLLPLAALRLACLHAQPPSPSSTSDEGRVLRRVRMPTVTSRGCFVFLDTTLQTLPALAPPQVTYRPS